MPFTCPHCGAHTDVSDEYAGRSGPCAQCGKTITVPPLGHAAPDISAGRPPTITTIVIILAVFLVAAVLCSGFVLLPLVSATREKGRQAACANNLKRIGQAMRQYYAKHGSFPPAYVADEQGRPVHSWRVLLLPYFQEEELLSLYRQYNFKEPWNSPRNLALANRMPAVYRCPSDVQESESGSVETSYVGITGPGTVFDGVKPENFLRPEPGKGFVPLGPGNVMLVAEQSASGINWLEPRDLDVDHMSLRINDPAGNAINAIRSNHTHGANALMCDGQARFLEDSTDPRQLQEMMTISVGENPWLTPKDGHKAATGGRAP